MRLLPGDRPLAFTVGTLFPEICWTEGVVRLLQEDEREIVLIHEETHRRHRDPLKALVLYILQKSLTGGEAILSHWRQRREEECDLACVERGHHPTQVAATVLKMQRAASLSPATPISLHYARSCDPHELRRRIENLLEPPGDSLGPGLPVLLLSLLGAAVILEAPFTHHFLETVLGWLTF
ncbi:MAG TPA: M48 family metalloprotease [Acidobacteriota bacterium]|nr:M48 family metalloprotease [Acidobacteriota bacterium]